VPPFRPFHNSDTPLLVDVWRSQKSQRGLMQPMSSTIFETMILAKPYFDAAGLIVALDGDRAIGFAHAGFGPTPDRQNVSTAHGAVSLLMTRPSEAGSSLPTDLLAAAEHYLTERGAKTIYGAGLRPVDPFYLGLYGGSEISGVLESDQAQRELFSSSCYQPMQRTQVLQLDLARFRPLVDRKLMQIRRRTIARSIIDPASRDWWEACTYGAFDRVAFELIERDSQSVVARVVYWALQPLATTWGVQAFGLLDLEVRLSERRLGAASHLVGESLRQLHDEGVSLIETHVLENNTEAIALFRKLGFIPVDVAVAYSKGSLAGAAPSAAT